MKILHISDFHLGSSSLEQDTDFPTITEDYIYKTKKFIFENLETDLLIFTGDLVSKGDTSSLNDPIILDFLNLFIENSIPILICNGNHDLKEEDIHTRRQFVDFTDFIIINKDNFGIKLSKSFHQNQASFIDFPKENLLFISLNSCHNIITNKEQDNKKPPTLPYKLTDEFFMELQDKFKEEFEFRNKILIIHHPLEELKNHLDSIRILKENKIKLLFAGDCHKYSKYVYDGITGFTAGTLYGSNKTKWNPLILKMEPNQFNYYEINAIDNYLKVFQYIKDFETTRWKLSYNTSLNIPLRGAWDYSSWCKYLEINSTIKKLNHKLKRIFEDTSKRFDYIALGKKSKIIKIFIQDNEDQKKVNAIKSWIKDKKLVNKNSNLIILDKTGKLKGQIPIELIIECVNDDKN